MTFSNKLNLLMKITETSNSALAKQLVFDPSYISRLRNGTRSLSKDSEYMMPIAKYIAKNCDTAEKIQMMSDVIGEDISSNIEERVFAFLNQPSLNAKVRAILSDMSAPVSNDKKSEENLLCFYGDEGRKEATLMLLSRAAKLNKPVTLLLFSDESGEWMNGISYEWESFLWQIILKQGKVKVIHKISYNIDEMFDIILRWLPFYATGAIDAYYYPKLRDGIYKRSLSVVASNAATFSTSIGAQTEVSPTFFTTDIQAVDAFTNEFYSYLSLCKPLIEFFKPFTKRYNQILGESIAKSKDNILKSYSLPIVSMPACVLKQIYQRYDGLELNKESPFLKGELFAPDSQSNTVHIIYLHDIDTVLANKALVTSATIYNETQIFYTPIEYKLHLENIVKLLQAHRHFSVYIDDEKPSELSLHVFEDNEAFIFNESTAGILFKITEKNTTNAFWDYMTQLVTQFQENHTRESVCLRIQNYIKELEDRMGQ
ncbi:hypothetical protein RFF05_12385 [Bengtsoniella intestinalis]|uniref:hypothetical protein n=1 Tax=Bengtsoniella intestinalis TaxID=3073143 RepID=UPI00391F1EBA